MAHDDAGTSPAGEGRRSASQDLLRDPNDAAATSRASAPTPARIPAIVGAVGAGVASAVLGTVLHGHQVSAGGITLPIGAAGALLLAGSLFLLAGLWARTIMMTALAGAVAYGIVALLSTSSEMLILTGSSETAPQTAFAGNLWLFGVLITTLATVMLGAAVLSAGKRR